MNKLLSLLLCVIVLTSCTCTKQLAYKYHIHNLESDTHDYVDRLPPLNTFKEDAEVYQLIANKYTKVLHVYE
jgi:hypothetical protein